MSKKTFCIDNIENIPSDIINMICSEKSEFHSWFHDDSGTHYIKSDHSIIYRNEKAAEIFELLRNYLSTCIIRAYHATRIIDDQEIIQDGLHPFELNSYTERIVGVLVGQGISIETGQLISKKIRGFVEWQGRENGYLSLFNSYRFYEDGYDQFTQNYGGETVRFAIADDHPEVFSLLCEIGIPVIVFCLVNWDDIVPIYQESYIQTVISAVLSKNILNIDDIEESEIRVNGKIAPSFIESITRVPTDSIKAEL